MQGVAKHITPVVNETQASQTGSKTFFKPKLAVGKPGDALEQEADTMADKVISMNRPYVQRKCRHCENEEKNVQRKESNNGTDVTGDNGGYISALNGKGVGLSSSEKNFFEPRFGYDFSNVRIHTGADAGNSAKNINALAYTHGNNIVFGEQQYRPGTDAGNKLMAHELTHVVQQNKGGNNAIQRKGSEGCGKDFLFEFDAVSNSELEKNHRGVPRIFYNQPTGKDEDIAEWNNKKPINLGAGMKLPAGQLSKFGWRAVCYSPSTGAPEMIYWVLNEYLSKEKVEEKKPEKKKEEPPQQEKAGGIEGPEIIYKGTDFTFTVKELAPVADKLDKASLKWAIKYDDGKVQPFTPTETTQEDDSSVSAKIKIPLVVTYDKCTLYAYTTTPENGASKDVQLKGVSFVESKHGKGTDENGKVAADMTYGDMTRDDIKKLNPLFSIDGFMDKNDDELFKIFEDMCTTIFATGEMEKVIVDMIKHFRENSGTDYTNDTLTEAVKNHDSTKRFIDEVLMELSRKVLAEKEVLHQTAVEKGKLDNKRPVFNSLADKAGGLTITINDTWAHEVNIISYDYVNDDNFNGMLMVNIYDDFGLDNPDVEKVYGYGAGFRAWFILQHLRGYKPFVTLIQFAVPFDQSIKELEPRKKAAEEAAEKARQERSGGKWGSSPTNRYPDGTWNDKDGVMHMGPGFKG